MGNFIATLILDFFVAFGVVFGASMLGGIGAVLSLQSPTHHMLTIAENIKIWALVAAIGGTIDPIREIESNLLGSHLSPVIKQILYILSAFLGAHTGTVLIQWITGGGLKS
jgi:hypothetical protein